MDIATWKREWVRNLRWLGPGTTQTVGIKSVSILIRKPLVLKKRPAPLRPAPVKNNFNI